MDAAKTPIVAGKLKELISKRVEQAQELFRRIESFLIADEMGKCESKVFSDHTSTQWFFGLNLPDCKFSIFWKVGDYRVGCGEVVIKYNDELVFKCQFHDSETNKMVLEVYHSGEWEQLIDKNKIEQLRLEAKEKELRQREHELERQEQAKYNRIPTESELAYAKDIGIELP